MLFTVCARDIHAIVLNMRSKKGEGKREWEEGEGREKKTEGQKLEGREEERREG